MPSSAEAITAINAQLDRCSSEIARRSTTQQSVQAGAVSAAWAIGAVVLAGVSPLALLLIPFICVAFGSQWLDQHRVIHEIGTYIRREVEPSLVARAGGLDMVPEFWETYNSRERQHDRIGRPWWAWPVLSVFYGLPLLALLLAAPSALIHPGDALPADMPKFSVEWWPWLLWSLGLLITCLGLWVSVKEFTRRSH